MPIDPGGRFFEGGQPIRVDGGIAVRAQRGNIGAQWWSRRFVDLLERICPPGRLARGRSYARKGQVIDFELTPGLVRGRVQGSRPEAYEVTLTIEAFDQPQWTRILESFATQAIYRAALLAGEMPHDLADLLPATVDMACTCPDWSVPCKHASAVLYVLAEAFDDDPFLVLAWRGRTRDEILGALRATPEPAGELDPLAVEETPLEARLSDFYAPTMSLSRLRERPARVAAPPELLLRALETPKIKIRYIPLGDLLRPAYRDLGAD